MRIMMITMRIVMITITVASSALPVLPNSTLEMYKRKREMVMTMMMMKDDDDHRDDDEGVTAPLLALASVSSRMLKSPALVSHFIFLLAFTGDDGYHDDCQGDDDDREDDDKDDDDDENYHRILKLSSQHPLHYPMLPHKRW